MSEPSGFSVLNFFFWVGNRKANTSVMGENEFVRPEFHLNFCRAGIISILQHFIYKVRRIRILVNDSVEDIEIFRFHKNLQILKLGFVKKVKPLLFLCVNIGNHGK